MAVKSRKKPVEFEQLLPFIDSLIDIKLCVAFEMQTLQKMNNAHMIWKETDNLVPISVSPLERFKTN